MGRLFWKLFISLSITLVLIGIGIGGGVYLHEQHERNADGIQRDRRAEFAVGLIANALHHGGVAGARDLLTNWPGQYPPRAMIVDADGRDALGQTVPQDALAKARALLERNHGRDHDDDHDNRSVREVKAPDDQRYIVFLPADSNAYAGPPRMLPISAQIAIALLASLLFSAIFASYMTRPIRHLRKVSTRLAEGDLDARVVPFIGNRNDELSELGADFDFMAGRLQSLIDAQRQLLHDVSHELRSPVARMRLAAGLAQQQPEKLQLALERIERETERLDELLGQILTLARLESNLNRDATEKVSLDELLAEIAEDVGFEAQALNRSVRFKVEHSAELQGQRELLRRAFENIIRNALKYTAENTAVEITLTADAKKPVVLIRDHGPGIPAAELDKVFQPFYRVSEKDKSQPTGYGLGLAIAMRALKKHAATLALNNAPDGGLLARITFH
ncbi:MAG: HAMP domain-containing protein [Methylobacillus sp.]|jgi:two-component system OmpR family sensor kinase|nr:HAMP domain-containing protein [Methylobacillus sp.]